MRIAAWLLVGILLYVQEAQADKPAQYPLDTVERVTGSSQGKLFCPKLALVTHTGTAVPYHKPVFVNAHFKPRLERFEAIVAKAAMQVYGRVPIRIKHLGVYSCRSIRRITSQLSEHALGNAIDIQGFDFGPASTSKQRAQAPHRRLQRAFRVRLGKHWSGRGRTAQSHARFLHVLTKQLIDDRTFRVMLGPAFPGHQRHFHFDYSPTSLIQL